jgi:hypothetical protein
MRSVLLNYDCFRNTSNEYNSIEDVFPSQSSSYNDDEWFNEFGESVISECKYTYMEFDQYGNWTKRKVEETEPDVNTYYRRAGVLRKKTTYIQTAAYTYFDNDNLQEIYVPASDLGQSWNIGYPTATDVIAILNNGTLTISGTGAMKNWQNTGSQDWYSVKDNITSVFIENGITTIGRIAFENCSKIASVSIPNSVKTVGEWAFAHCHSLTSITIPNNVETLESGVFEDCRNLALVIIGNNVKTIGSYTFKSCRSLASITIPNTVTSIGFEVFCNCTSLTNLIVNWATPLSIDGSVFSGVTTSNVKLYVPSEARSKYSTAPFWKNFNIVL